MHAFHPLFFPAKRRILPKPRSCVMEMLRSRSPIALPSIRLFLPPNSLSPPDAPQLFTALLAISSAPSLLAFPPMNPDACTNTHPSTPATASNSRSRKPRHSAGRGFRLSKLPSLAPTAWTRHLVDCGAVESSG